MKKAIIPFAALALSLASCDTGVKDSYQTQTYTECNLIVDLQDTEQPAQISIGKYEVKINYSQDLIDVKASDIIINNQKYSFETEPAAIQETFLTTADGTRFQKLTFSPTSTASSSASKIKAEFVFWRYPMYFNPINPNFEIGYNSHLGMSYDISGRYHVQTFCPDALYTGNSAVTEGSDSFSTKKTMYAVMLNLEKNVANVYIYYPEHSVEMPKDYPNVICLSEVPLKIKHDSFGLEASNPKTTISGKNDKDQETFVESSDFQVTDFNLTMLSEDLTETYINFNLGGRKYSFRGCSVLKSGM